MITSNELQDKIIASLKAETAQMPHSASLLDFWRALSRVVVELLTERWEKTSLLYKAGRQTHYFSAEFLEGRSLLNNLINLGLYDTAKKAVAGLGHDLADLLEQETDPGLGNGGLGRLAACFLDSAATADLPVSGYGILYRFGLFRQEFEDGFQKEYPDAWMEQPYPFVVRREQQKILVHFSDLDVIAVPYDLPVTGYKTDNINTLRLWKAEPALEFDFNLFNSQRFDDAVMQHNRVNDICRVLYPNDSSYDGKVLRARQQYFFVSASLQSIVADYIRHHGRDFSRFAEFNSIQLNDTHPVIAIPELMRILLDEHGMGWTEAWSITNRVFAYTNHTIMAEALEKWDIGIFQFLLPRIMQIIERIDDQFRQEARQRGLNEERINYMSPLGDGKIRMAWLAIYGSHSINGVAAMHSRILQTETLQPFYEIWPERFSNKTNGVTPRRWLHSCNPGLAGLLEELYGDDSYLQDMKLLEKLRPYQDDKAILQRLRQIKLANKQRLTDHIKKAAQLEVDPQSIFDVQIKRLHEYKRQLLNAFLILDDYFRIKKDPASSIHPSTYIFGAKAAPGYFRAKAIIKFINEIARMVNNDPVVSQHMKVVFLANYNVSQAELIFPAADISEQISTVGMEASGTGNMKFMLNGALTLGTCDGANVEIAETVGYENAYVFGCRVEDFPQTKGYYNPLWQYEHIPGLRRVVDSLVDGTFSDNNTGMFRDLFNSLLYGSDWQPADPYYVLGDFAEYRDNRHRAQRDYLDQETWSAKCWRNIIAAGQFSSDRTVQEYVDGIWRIEPRPI